MPFLDKACFVVDLQKGSEYIGWFGAVITVLKVIIDIYNFTRPDLVSSFIMFDIIISMSQYLISVCLIKGARNKNSRLLKPWLISTIINLLASNLFDLVMAITYPGLAAFYILGILIKDQIIVYLWLCVYSFYQVLAISDPETVIIEDAGTTRI